MRAANELNIKRTTYRLLELRLHQTKEAVHAKQITLILVSCRKYPL